MKAGGGSSLPPAVLLGGGEGPPPARTALRAGPLSMSLEEGDLRSIRLGAREVIRRIHVAVRDPNWGTVPAVLSGMKVEKGDDSFQVSYLSRHRQGDIDFSFEGAIRGDRDGAITFTMEGEALSTFFRNRLGFCVLHPIRECAGEKCRVEKTDGSVEEGVFPLSISPVEPFRDIRAISHPAAPGLWAEVRFSGEVFEMEDQRNWTDASYKTYSTPLALPFPVEVPKGTRIAQSVALTLRGKAPATPAGEPAGRVMFLVGGPTAGPSTGGKGALPVPRVGLGLASHGQPLNPKEVERLRALRLSHLRLDLRPSRPEHRAALLQAIRESRALSAPLEIALFLSGPPEEELGSLVRTWSSMRPEAARWLIFHEVEKSTDPGTAEEARKFLGRYLPAAEIGGGTDCYFAELNRAQLPLTFLDLVSFSANPQVHAFDDATVMENLEGQASAVESARRLAKGLPVALSPITLRPRFNPDATGPEAEPAPGELPSTVDPRQMSVFGAAWTLGSLATLFRAGIHSATYYETTGWRGVMETASGPPVRERFRSWPGSVYPLYHVLADLGEFRDGELLLAVSSAGEEVDGLALREGQRTRVLLANLRPEPRAVTVKGAGPLARIRSLDAGSAEEAMRSPESYRSKGAPLQGGSGEVTLELPPYGVVTLDSA